MSHMRCSVRYLFKMNKILCTMFRSFRFSNDRLMKNHLMLIFTFFSVGAIGQSISLDSVSSVKPINRQNQNIKLLELKSGKKLIYDLDNSKSLASYEYFNLNHFGHEIAIVKNKNLYGAYNTKLLKATIPTKYKHLKLHRHYLDGFSKFIIAQNSNDQYGLLNYEGDTIISFNYSAICDVIPGSNQIIVNDSSKIRILDTLENIVCEHVGKLHFSSRIGNYIFTKDSNRKMGLMDLNCQIIVPNMYDDVSYLIEGTRLIKLNGKHGLVEEDGTIILNPVFNCIKRIFNDSVPQNLRAYEIEYNQEKFNLNKNFECIENCQDKKLLNSLGIK